MRPEGRWLAAVLAAGPGAALSHGSAAALHGIGPANGVVVHVTATRRIASTPRRRMHRARLDPVDRAVVRGVPATTLARTLVDLATILPAMPLAKALAEADRLHPLDVSAIEHAAARVRGRRGPGPARLAAALADHRALGATLTRSALEDAFLRLVRDADLPAPRTNARVEGFEVDALWPGRRLIVELDGWEFHRARHAFQHDRTRDMALAVAGYQVIRCTHADLTRRADHVATTLRRLLT